MKNSIIITLLTAVMIFGSCTSLVEDINVNPNKIAFEEAEPVLFLTGALLANSSMSVGHLNRISAMWTGQLVGYSSLYSNIYGYNISSAETDGTWNRQYIGIIPNTRYIVSQATNDNLLKGISKVTEGMGMTLIASLFGDVPYAEVLNDEIEDPTFDSQVSVLNAALNLLDDGLADLNNASSRSLSQDIYFNGDVHHWIATAHTLKARIHTYFKDYSSAYSSATQGISSKAGNLMHIPRGSASVDDGDKNLFYEILAGSRAGDIGSEGSFLLSLLDETSENYRGNDKTVEAARHAYYGIDATTAGDNQGVANQFEPQPIVTFQENHLTLAEAGARSGNFETGLMHLNEYRAWLNDGNGVNSNFQDSAMMYMPYEAADFQAGGMENMDGIDPMRALLREIIEERYVSGFMSFMPFDDARRLRASDMDISVPIPLNVTSASQQPERFPYSVDEINTNSKAPTDPGIFAKTEVNR